MTIAAHGSAGESLKINAEIVTIKVAEGPPGAAQLRRVEPQAR